MPRLPVDGKKVIEHRITLGTFERERLDTLITGLTIKNIGTPAVALLNDVTGMIAIVAIIDQLFGYQILSAGTSTIEGLVDDVKTFRQQRKTSQDTRKYASDYAGEGLVAKFLSILEGLGDAQRFVVTGQVEPKKAPWQE